MLGSTLVKTLKLFDQAQLKRLEQFVSSPYFNPEIEKGKSSTLRLLEILTDTLSNKEDAALTKQKVFQLLFPDRKFSDSTIEKIKVSLLKLIRKFISFENLREMEFYSILNLAEFYRVNGWKEKFNSEVKKARRFLSDTSIRDEIHYHKLLQLELIEYQFQNDNNRRQGDLNLPNMLNTLDIFYLLAKYKYAGLLSQQRKYVDVDFEEIISIGSIKLKKASFDKYSLLKMYKCLLELISNNSKEVTGKYNLAKDLIEENQKYIPDEEYKILRAFLRNFCTAQRNLGRNNFLSLLFQLYKEDLDYGRLYVENKIQASAVVNITVVGLLLNEHEWVWNFLQNHKGEIIGAERPEEVYNLSLANYYFNIKEYDKAEELLNWGYIDIYYILNARRIEIKVLYETKQFDRLDSKLNAFKVFVFREKNKQRNSFSFEMNNAFLKFLYQILTPSTMKNEKRITKIEDKIKNEIAVADKEWLLEKLEELKP